MKIEEIESGSRPREKMMDFGAEALTNSELLCLLLNGGVRGAGAPELAGKVLSLCDGSLASLSRLAPQRLCIVPGIGVAKASTLAAAFELGRRCADEGTRWDKKMVCGPRRIYDILIPHMKGLDHEECWCLFLNTSQYVVAREMMFVGGMDSTVIDTRMIVRRALELGASSVVLSHNHPAGNPLPSKADISQTSRLSAALSAMDISLLDHVVVCDDCFYSFSDEKKFPAR